MSMSRVRKHFCTLVARGQGAGSSPRKYGLNGTMPGDGEQHGGVVRDEAGRRHDLVAPRGEEAGERGAELVGVHFAGRSYRPVTWTPVQGQRPSVGDAQVVPQLVLAPAGLRASAVHRVPARAR